MGSVLSLIGVKRSKTTPVFVCIFNFPGLVMKQMFQVYLKNQELILLVLFSARIMAHDVILFLNLVKKIFAKLEEINLVTELNIQRHVEIWKILDSVVCNKLF